jgi:hypothetical protein
MVRLEVDHGFERAADSLRCLPGDSDHEVEGQGVEAGFTGRPAKAQGFGPGVGPLERPQDAVIEGLDADAQAGDARFAPSPDELRPGNDRIGLERELGDLQGEMGSGEVEDGRDVVPPEKGRRSAADVDRVETEIEGPRSG